MNVLDMEPGKEIGALLDQLLEKVLNEEIPNERENLLQEAFSFTRLNKEQDQYNSDEEYEQDF